MSPKMSAAAAMIVENFNFCIMVNFLCFVVSGVGCRAYDLQLGSNTEQCALYFRELSENAEKSGLIGGRHGRLGDSTRIRARSLDDVDPVEPVLPLGAEASRRGCRSGAPPG
jgi:hypothetical protein